MRKHPGVRRCRALPLLLVLAACGSEAATDGDAEGHGAPAAHGSPATEQVEVSDAGRELAAGAGREACASWAGVAGATDLTQVAQLRVKAEVGALKAARNDPSWNALAQDLAELRVLEADYAAAGATEAKALLASIEEVRARIPSHCPP